MADPDLQIRGGGGGGGRWAYRAPSLDPPLFSAGPKGVHFREVNNKKNQQGRKLTATSVMQDSDYS